MRKRWRTGKGGDDVCPLYCMFQSFYFYFFCIANFSPQHSSLFSERGHMLAGGTRKTVKMIGRSCPCSRIEVSALVTRGYPLVCLHISLYIPLFGWFFLLNNDLNGKFRACLV